MMRRLRSAAFMGCVLTASVLGLLSITRPEEGPAASLPEAVRVDLPTTATAGGTVRGAITPAGPHTVTFLSATSAGTLDVESIGDTAWFEIGPPLTDRVGTISVLVATTRGPVHATVTVEAGAATAIDPLAGPRTIVADGEDETMVVTIPTDALGNRLPDGTPVSVGLVTPDGDRRNLTATTLAGLAAVRFTSTTASGPVAVAARSGSAVGPAVRVDQVAGAPEAFALELARNETETLLVADGRSLSLIATGELHDRYGNILPDGVGVDVAIDGPDGPGHLVAVVAGGRAEFRVQAPSRPGSMTIEATVDATTSAPLVVPFAAAVTRIPVHIESRAGTMVATIGPVLDRHGAFVPDGTNVAIGTATAVIQTGMATATLAPNTLVETITISVLGTVTSVEVPPWS